MIITRRLAGRLKTVFRQALSLPNRGTMPTIELVAGPSGLQIRCGLGTAAVEFWLDGEQPEERLYIPFELLSDLEGRREAPVEVHQRDGQVTATWRDGSVPQLVQHPTPVVVAKDWPPSPERLFKNPPRLTRALADASATTDPDSLRYALGCVQLHGDHGSVIATDGRQLLAEDGFSFPWDGELLLPVSAPDGLSAGLFGQANWPDDWPIARSVRAGQTVPCRQCLSRPKKRIITLFRDVSVYRCRL